MDWFSCVSYHAERYYLPPSTHSSQYVLVHLLRASNNQVLAPRSHARHYFDEVPDTMSEAGDRTPYTPFSAYSAVSPSPSELNTLEDISPEAL